MSIFGFSRYALLSCAAVAMLAGCGGLQPIGVPGAISASGASFAYHKTFHYTGTKQSFKVPAGVTQLQVVALGAVGASDYHASGGGHGGRVHAIIPVAPGERLTVFVGGAAPGLNSRHGGFNGGGGGGGPYECCTGEGGGGASDVRQGGDRLSNRIVVAGGGGGQGGGNESGRGGGGGGLIGGSGAESIGGGADGGKGGTQDSGGAGGLGWPGSYPGGHGRHGERRHGGRGGREGDGYTGESEGEGGGGGGGGYFGGGGGGGGNGNAGSGAGGGGGSSYVEPSATNVHMLRGFKNATSNGLVVLSW
jgi:Glycine rich protein